MFSLSFPIILSTFGIIFLAELPDRTALASLVLATKFGARAVLVGTWLALLLQSILAVAGGSFLSLLPTRPVHIIAGLGFLIFAFLAFTRREEKIESEEEQEVEKEAKKLRPVWITSFLVVFAAEFGDLTQLATAGLVVRVGHPLSVGIGATLALWAVSTMAAVAGSQLTRFINPQKLTLVSGAIFAFIGMYTILSAFS